MVDVIVGRGESDRGRHTDNRSDRQRARADIRMNARAVGRRDADQIPCVDVGTIASVSLDIAGHGVLDDRTPLCVADAHQRNGVGQSGGHGRRFDRRVGGSGGLDHDFALHRLNDSIVDMSEDAVIDDVLRQDQRDGERNGGSDPDGHGIGNTTANRGRQNRDVF